MMRIRRFEEKCAELYSRREDPRLLAPLRRRGGGRRRASCRRSTPDDAVVSHVPRARPRARARRPRGRGDGRDVRQGRGLQPRARRLDAPVRRLAALLRRQRDRGRRAAARRRARARRHDAGAASGHGLLLRRRRDRRGRVPRVAQPRRALEAARPLRLREQPLRDGDGALAPPGADRPRAQGRGLSHPRRARRRHGRRRRRGGGAARRGPRARGRRPLLPRAR